MASNLKRAWREIAGAGSIKAKLAIFFYRMSTLWRSRNPLLKLTGLPFAMLNKLVNECLFCVEIPHHTRIGYGLKLYHPHCVVIGRGVVIGENCTLRQGVTIGNVTYRNGDASESPVLGNDVELGANAVVIGAITIGDGVTIGAGTVVTKDLPPGATVVGGAFRTLNARSETFNAPDGAAGK